MKTPLLEAVNITVSFPLRRGLLGNVVESVKALDNVSLSVVEGEVLGIVGESGSGKTTLARCLVGLVKPDSGRVLYVGNDIFKLKGALYRRFRREVQMVFQNPYTSLNPTMKVKDIIKDVLKASDNWDARGEERVKDLLKAVGLGEDVLHKYPSELSGGQAQRVAIARALATKPKIIILDEPTSALDVSLQAQILELLSDLKRRENLTYIIISHDISVIRYISTRVVVLYKGRIVEEGPPEEIINNSKNPYTRKLVEDVLYLYEYIEKR